MIAEAASLDNLRTFLDVCRHGSLSRVAAQTGRAQSALSMQMRRLETSVGHRLFTRTGRGVVPTPEGELLLSYATRIVALADEALMRLSQAPVSGCVRVGLAEEVATASLSLTLGHLHRAYPSVRLDVVVEHSVSLGRRWAEGELDLLIGPTSVVVADALAVWSVDLQWVCAHDYRPDQERPLDLVTFSAPCLWRQRMIDALTAIGQTYQITFTSQSITALQVAVESGLGVGALLPDAIKAGAVRVLSAPEGLQALTVQYGLYARDRRSPAVEVAVAGLMQGAPLAPVRAAVRRG
jgi:DNA-binding transcriptional LysR family regulator